MRSIAVRSSGGCCSVLGTTFFAGSLSEAADLVIDRALSGEGGYATLTGVHGVTLANDDNLVRMALDGMDGTFLMAPQLARYQRRLGMAGAERVGGPDLMPLVIDRGRRVDLRHFLFGSTPEVLELLERQIGRLYPGALVVGSVVLDSVRSRRMRSAQSRRRSWRPIRTSSGSDWAPKQDTWCHANAHRVSPGLCVGVGAAFDFLAGTKRRAPRWMQRSGCGRTASRRSLGSSHPVTSVRTPASRCSPRGRSGGLVGRADDDRGS